MKYEGSTLVLVIFVQKTKHQLPRNAMERPEIVAFVISTTDVGQGAADDIDEFDSDNDRQLYFVICLSEISERNTFFSFSHKESS